MEQDSSSDTSAPAPGEVLKLNPLIMATEDTHTVQGDIGGCTVCTRVHWPLPILQHFFGPGEALKCEGSPQSLGDRPGTERLLASPWASSPDVTSHGDLDTDTDTSEG